MRKGLSRATLLISAAIAAQSCSEAGEGVVQSQDQTSVKGDTPDNTVAALPDPESQILPSSRGVDSQVCDLGAMLGLSQSVLKVEAASVQDELRDPGGYDVLLASLELSGAREIGRYEPRGTPTRLGGLPEPFETVVVDPYGGFGTFPEASPDTELVLFLGFSFGSSASTDEPFPVVTGIATARGEEVALVGRCGTELNGALSEVAGDVGSLVNIDFLRRVRDDPEVAERLSLALSSEVAWIDLPPAERPLRVGAVNDIPRSERQRFAIVGLYVDGSDSGSQVLEIRSDQGIIARLGLPAEFDLLPVAVERSLATVEIWRAPADDPMKLDYTRIAIIDAALLDEVLGAEFLLTNDGATVRVLEQGELEVRSGLSREELEELRAGIYAAPDG